MGLTNRIQKLLAAAAIVTAAVATLDGGRAEAQVAARPLIEYKTEGGRVLWNYRLQIYASGRTVATMTSPRQPQDVLTIEDHVRPAVVMDLAYALYRAKIHSLAPVVRTRATIYDMPERVVRFAGKTVRFTTMGSPRDPIATPFFVDAINRIAAHFDRIANEPFVQFDTRNGMMGLDQTLTITRAGWARLARTIPGDRPYLKETQLDFARMNAIKQAMAQAHFFQLPDSFIPNPPPPFAGNVYDMTGYDARDRMKSVHTQDGATLPRDVQALLNTLNDTVGQIYP
jgi:hypothetical protein